VPVGVNVNLESVLRDATTRYFRLECCSHGNPKILVPAKLTCRKISSIPKSPSIKMEYSRCWILCHRSDQFLQRGRLHVSQVKYSRRSHYPVREIPRGVVNRREGGVEIEAIQSADSWKVWRHNRTFRDTLNPTSFGYAWLSQSTKGSDTSDIASVEHSIGVAFKKKPRQSTWEELTRYIVAPGQWFALIVSRNNIVKDTSISVTVSSTEVKLIRVGVFKGNAFYQNLASLFAKDITNTFLPILRCA